MEKLERSIKIIRRSIPTHLQLIQELALLPRQKKKRERKNNTTSKFIKEVSKGVSFDGFTYQISRQSWLIVHTCGRNVRKEGEIEIRSTDFRPFSFFPPLLSFFTIKKTPTFANFDRYLLSSFRYDF